jgi:putative ABC transport system substrate-binding protein
MSAKLLELLKEIAPNVTRAGIIRDPALASGPAQFAAIQSMAPSLGMEVGPINVRDASEIERAIAAFARANSGLVVIGSAVVAFHRHRIIALAARDKLPAVYQERSYVDSGGLISYGPNFIDQYRRAAGYVDGSLKARSRPSCQCRRRPITSWSSISRLPRRSVSTCQRPCSPAPTR